MYRVCDRCRGLKVLVIVVGSYKFLHPPVLIMNAHRRRRRRRKHCRKNVEEIDMNCLTFTVVQLYFERKREKRMLVKRCISNHNFCGEIWKKI